MSYQILNNYLTMGNATSVPISTFSPTTLSGYIDLADNCLVFDTRSPYPYRHVTATHCRSTGKYEVWCRNLRYSIVIISWVISELVWCPVFCNVKTEQFGCMIVLVCHWDDHMTTSDQLRRLYFPIGCSDSSALAAKPFYTGGRECMFRYGCCDTGSPKHER